MAKLLNAKQMQEFRLFMDEVITKADNESYYSVQEDLIPFVAELHDRDGLLMGCSMHYVVNEMMAHAKRIATLAIRVSGDKVLNDVEFMVMDYFLSEVINKRELAVA